MRSSLTAMTMLLLAIRPAVGQVAEQVADLTPYFRVANTSGLDFVFENASEEPFRFWGRQGDIPPDMVISLSKNKQVIQPIFDFGPFGDGEPLVIEPGQAIAVTLDLGRKYYKLGQENVTNPQLPRVLIPHLVQAIYNRDEGDERFTPLSLDKRLLYLQLSAHAGEAGRVERVEHADGPAGISGFPSVDLTPYARVGAGATIDFLFENTSEETISYLPSPFGQPTDLAIGLYRDGQYIAREEQPFPDLDRQPAMLKAGENMKLSLTLADYENLEGRYLICASYLTPEDDPAVKEKGVTPLRFRKRVLYLDVVKKGGRPPPIQPRFLGDGTMSIIPTPITEPAPR